MFCSLLLPLSLSLSFSGHFDPGKTVPENLKMSAPLLSRFDLIYILLDKADVKRGSLLSHQNTCFPCFHSLFSFLVSITCFNYFSSLRSFPTCFNYCSSLSSFPTCVQCLLPVYSTDTFCARADNHVFRLGSTGDQMLTKHIMNLVKFPYS